MLILREMRGFCKSLVINGTWKDLCASVWQGIERDFTEIDSEESNEIDVIRLFFDEWVVVMEAAIVKPINDEYFKIELLKSWSNC
jgi:hypothetical protein